MASQIFEGESLLTLPGIKGSPIEGVKVQLLRKIPDERGAIYHMMRRDSELFQEFGEIYFSKVNPGVIKAWHLHSRMVLNYAVIVGSIKLVLYDDRPKSPTRRNLLEIFTGEENYLLVQIPAKVWNGFKGISVYPSLVANCSTSPHERQEIKRVDPFSKKIPYDWNIKHG